MINTHTFYSLRYGTVKPDDVLQLLADGGFDTVVHTDVNNTSACLDMIRMSAKHGLRPIVGIDFRNGAQQRYIGIAINNEGFRELNDHLSHHLHNALPFDEHAPTFSNAFIIYPYLAAEKWTVDQLSTLRDYERIGVRPQDLNRFRFSPVQRKADQCVAMQTMTFRDKKDFNAHRLLRAIDNNELLSKLPKTEEAPATDLFLSKAEFEKAFALAPQLVEQTKAMLEQCTIDFTFGTEQPHHNLRYYTGNEDEDIQLLRQLTYAGLAYRYPQCVISAQDENGTVTHRTIVREESPDLYPIIDRIEKELQIIHEKGFISYFLINWDITSYARSKGYFYVGRGSGANSIIAYILRITDVDPIELDLYFERFINLYRKNPPDFDIDFSWTDREDITHYIFSRFPNVALVGAYNTFQFKAVVRELGKVFGLPKTDIDLLSEGKFNIKQLDSMSQLVLKYSAYIQEFPNHISPHSCGILIANRPLHYYTATLLPPKGYPTTHFDMIVAEDAGLYKFDILSQRGLGKIKDTLEILKYNQPDVEEIDIHNMTRFKNDERIKDLLRTAKAIGCFYVESPAMRMLLRKLQVDDYLGLVAASSVIRPGVSSSGMMKEYILRHRDPERRKASHPQLLEIMPETYGVMVYQEDVIKVAHYFAGLDLGEADSLRRGMSGKFRGREEFDQARNSFFSKARQKGHREEDIAEIWRQTASFAGYAFAKGHSASYAVESYQSLFLKAYYPLEYMTATINNFGGFYSTELYVHEARMHGATIEPPCVNRGSAESYIIGTHIVLGFGLVRALEHTTIEALMMARAQEGEFLSLDDFLQRISVSLEQVSILIRIGAFRFTQRDKKEMLWEVYFRLGKTKKTSPVKTLFDTAPRQFKLPRFEYDWVEEAYEHIELLGFPLCNPFNLVSEPTHGETPAEALPNMIGQEVKVVGYLVTIKPTKTLKGERMYFGTFVDRAGHFLDTVHFPPVAQQYSWRGRGIYEIVGKVLSDFDALSVEVHSMRKLSYYDDPRYSEGNVEQRMEAQKKLDGSVGGGWR